MMWPPEDALIYSFPRRSSPEGKCCRFMSGVDDWHFSNILGSSGECLHTTKRGRPGRPATLNVAHVLLLQEREGGCGFPSGRRSKGCCWGERREKEGKGRCVWRVSSFLLFRFNLHFSLPTIPRLDPSRGCEFFQKCVIFKTSRFDCEWQKTKGKEEVGGEQTGMCLIVEPTGSWLTSSVL